MNTPVRLIRFGRSEAEKAEPSRAEIVGHVFLHGLANASGRIVHHADAGVYLLADDTCSGLSSTDSRHDLEAQIIAFHFGPQEFAAG